MQHRDVGVHAARRNTYTVHQVALLERCCADITSREKKSCGVPHPQNGRRDVTEPEEKSGFPSMTVYS